jgi:hypothetical protein
MSVPDSDTEFKLKPFNTIVFDDLNRLFDTFEKEEFTFHVNGAKVTSNVVEAVLISPKIHDFILNDRSIRSFIILDEKVEVETVEKFLSFFRCRSFRSFLREDGQQFLSLCRLFWNDRLFLIFHSYIESSSS